MNWDDLRYFLSIARAGSLAGAARRLGVNHSTVYRRLNALERSLAVRLFDRHPEGYALTGAGTDILATAEQIENQFADVETRLRGRDFALSGHVRITTAPNLAYAYLPDLLADFGKHYPQIQVEVAVGDTDYDLRRREADIALRATPNPPDFLIGRPIAALPWFACASPDYLARFGTPKTETDLANHRLIGADDGFARLTVFDWVRRTFPSDSVMLTCNDLSSMAAMADRSLGVAFLPADLHRDGLTRLMPVCPAATGQLWLLTHPDLRRVLRVRALMQFMVEHLRADSRLAPFLIPAVPE